MIGSTKIYKPKPEVSLGMFGRNEVYIGFAGSASSWGKAIGYLTDPTGQKFPKLKDIEFVMLTNKKEILYSQDLSDWMEVEDKFWSIGSGMQFALGAMATGKTPLEAVKVAAKLDSQTGMGYKEYSFE